MIAPACVGLVAGSIEAIGQDLQRRFHIFGHSGAVMFGLSALDIRARSEAVWDSLHETHAQIYKNAGNIRAVQPLLGHTKLEGTVRYLGIEVDDALAIRIVEECGAPLSQSGAP
jgi:hypothetical protein